MAICSCFTYYMLNWIINSNVDKIIEIGVEKVILEKLVTIIALIVAVLIYAISIGCLKVFSKEEIYMIPYGQKIYKLLYKIGIYKEK